jgi:alanine racemase
MNHTWLEIDTSAFHHNIAIIKSIIGTTKLGLMLKANAYGHGIIPMAKLAQEHPDVNYLFTSLTSEALQLRASGITKPISVLVFDDTDLEEVIAHDIEMILFDRTYIPQLAKAAKKVGKPIRVHVKVDTGMSRLGLFYSQLSILFDEIKNYPEIRTVGIMTHLSDADNDAPDAIEFTRQQLDCFENIVQNLPAHISTTLEVVHACASSGAIFFNKKFSLVRMGEAAYGFVSLVRVATNALGYFKPAAQQERFKRIDLAARFRPILTWKTRIIQLKKIPTGSFVGYNRTYSTQRETVIAILPIGYADGYSRLFSNCGKVLVRGYYAPVIGRVSMNLCTIDVTDVPGVALYDEVILMGNYAHITADDLARKIETLNLVILTSINPLIPRLIV